MKKLLLLLVLLSVAVQAFAQPGLRLGGGYGWLFMPDFKELNDVPTIDITRGGGSITLQFLAGRVTGIDNLSWGVELGFLRQYRYEFYGSLHNEVTLNSFPFLAVLEYGFAKSGAKTVPFFQLGAGLARDELITEWQTSVSGDNHTMELTYDLALMAGPGVSFRITDRVSIDALLQYYLLYTGNEYTTRLNAAAFVGYRL